VYELTRVELLFDPLREFEQALEPVPPADRADMHALLVQELQRLHEGVLARYGLRPSELGRGRLGHNAMPVIASCL
jgi:hypothetical protein